jgi:hypothetical protein
MKIKYFAVDEEGCIGKYMIDTDQKEYVSHTDTVVVTRNYDFDGNPLREMTWRRNFDDLILDMMADLRDKMDAFECLCEGDVDDYTTEEYNR